MIWEQQDVHECASPCFFLFLFCSPFTMSRPLLPWTSVCGVAAIMGFASSLVSLFELTDTGFTWSGSSREPLPLLIVGSSSSSSSSIDGILLPVEKPSSLLYSATHTVNSNSTQDYIPYTDILMVQISTVPLRLVLQVLQYILHI